MIETLTFSFERQVSAAEFKSLADQTGWAEGRLESDIIRSLEGSFAVLGVWDDDRIVGVLRVISDGVYVAQILDVTVDDTYRGHGIGTEMMHRVLDRYSNIEILMLACGPQETPFYEKFGFRSGIRMSRRSDPLSGR